MTIKNVITAIVDNDLCIGCGLCVPACSSSALEMRWNKFGLCEPFLREPACDGCPACLSVCPFADGVIGDMHLQNEDEIGQQLLTNPRVKRDKYLGLYQDIYVGYSKECRSVGSSGGIATWALIHLLTNGYIDAALCVQPVKVSSSQEGIDKFFAYSICNTREAIYASAKTRYHPAPIDQVVKIVMEKRGRYALVALPCTLKALRLAQGQIPILKERIVFTIGIFCGGLKSRNYTEYLAAAAGVNQDQISAPDYRGKRLDSTADDYEFSCEDADYRRHVVSMRSLGDMWGTGLFKPNACDFCDDLSAELADLSLGDAWLSPYREDGRGNSLIVARSDTALNIIAKGINEGELVANEITPLQANKSQQGNITHRRHGLALRLHWSKKKGLPVPRKRVMPRRSLNPLFISIQSLRMQIRRKSHLVWLDQRGIPGTSVFDSALDPELRKLQKVTRLSHLLRNPALVWQSICHKIRSWI